MKKILSLVLVVACVTAIVKFVPGQILVRRPMPAAVPLSFDAATSTTGNGISSKTFSHTIGSSANFLLVGISYFDSFGKNVNSVTWNGVSMTNGGSRELVGATFKTQFFYLTAPATGTRNVVVTFSASIDDTVIGAVSFNGVNQSTPIGSLAGADGTGTDLSVTATSATGELVVDVFCLNGGTPVTPGAGQTQRYFATGSAGNIRGGVSTKAGATSTNMTWTQSSSGGWVHIALPLKPQ